MWLHMAFLKALSKVIAIHPTLSFSPRARDHQKRLSHTKEARALEPLPTFPGDLNLLRQSQSPDQLPCARLCLLMPCLVELKPGAQTIEGTAGGEMSLLYIPEPLPVSCSPPDSRSPCSILSSPGPGLLYLKCCKNLPKGDGVSSECHMSWVPLAFHPPRVHLKTEQNN